MAFPRIAAINKRGMIHLFCGKNKAVHHFAGGRAGWSPSKDKRSRHEHLAGLAGLPPAQMDGVELAAATNFRGLSTT